MSFQTGLSGLNASSRNLDVIGHNIANANTAGMKSSRAEFADIVSASLGGGAGGGGSGIGVSVATVSQQFTQGNINITGNGLDLAINGGGFFQLTMPDGTAAYTRDGSFKLDKDGNVVTNSGASLMGFELDPATGKPTSVTTKPLSLPTGAPITAKQTENITAEFNLDARSKVATGIAADPTATPPIVAVPATPRATYGTSINVYDAQGVATPVSLYFEKTATENTWDVYSGLLDTPNIGDHATPVGSIVFDAAGKIASITSAATVTPPNVAPPDSTFFLTLDADTIASANPNLTTGSLPQQVNIKIDSVTQFGNVFSVSNLKQDGYTSGEFVGMTVGEDGVISARYSNGETQSNGQIALAAFRNVQGLSPTGGNNWIETPASGQPIQGSPGSGKFGGLRAGALEDSNVDLTAELVNMMVAQRAYQANAQTIKTQDQVLSTLVNLR